MCADENFMMLLSENLRTLREANVGLLEYLRLDDDEERDRLAAS